MFSPLLGLSHFFLDCAWVNNNNKLYILGGIDDSSSSSKIFLLYDPIKDKIRRLPDSKYPHSKHSLFAYNDMIYAIGGDLQKLGGGIFLCTPNTVNVEGKITDDGLKGKEGKSSKNKSTEEEKEEEEYNW